MKRSLHVWILFAASAALATGCTLPYDSPHMHIAQHQPFIQPATSVLPPATMLQHPGPGVDGPGPGVMMPEAPIGAYGMQPATSQIGFRGNDGMKVLWDVGGPGAFDSEPLVEPGRYNFPQAAIYRLKLTNIPGHAGVELYPTLEIAQATPRTEAFLAHNYVPFELTAEDFEQVLSGNFVTKVLYLPDSEHQEPVVAGAETLVSTRLEPGKDPVVEAERRGSIMAIIRLGNKDLQIPGNAGPNGNPEVVQAGFHGALMHGPAMGCGGYGPQQGYGMPPGYVAGVTAPMYGMPMCGTPIGLPGPPHIPLGIPAGLEQHVVTNYTHMSIPPPVQRVDVNVKQVPGLSYPKPVTQVNIEEDTPTPPVMYQQPHADSHQIAPGGSDGACDCDYNAR